jgi:GSH-dependent disulfide-bond oxidoreductase
VRDDDCIRPDVSSGTLMPRSSRTRAVKSAKSLTQKVARLKRAKPKRATRRSAPRSNQPIELFYWPTPSGWKVSIMLKECGVPYVVRPVDISKGEQFSPQFLAISPNNRMPVIRDPNGPGGRPISVFESGAILQYLGRKTGQFYPRDERACVAVDEWLFWQMGGLGPMAGQANHFRLYAPEKIAYAIDRYTNEVNRLFGVMNTRLAAREFLAGRYSIADMACVGWVRLAERMGQELAQFPHLDRWFETIRAAGGQTRFRDPRRSGVRGRHEGSESARHSVRSDGAVTSGRIRGRATRRQKLERRVIGSGRGDVPGLRQRNPGHAGISSSASRSGLCRSSRP